jgi:hypothetical protein
VLLASCLAGCSSVGSFAGAVAGIATGTATANPAVAIAVGIGVKTATDAASKVAGRRIRQAEQDQIAEVAGELGPGETRSWEARYAIAFFNQRGEVRVTGVIDTQLALCKEILFSVEEGEASSWFAASVCRQADRWKWANAEAAVERWGNLQ